jgi:hypothetical protein
LSVSTEASTSSLPSGVSGPIVFSTGIPAAFARRSDGRNAFGSAGATTIRSGFCAIS